MANKTNPMTLSVGSRSNIPVSNGSNSSIPSNSEMLGRVPTILERKRNLDKAEKLWHESYTNAERRSALSVGENGISADGSNASMRKLQSIWKIEKEEKTADSIVTENGIGRAVGQLKRKLEQEKVIEKVSEQVSTKEETKQWLEENPEKKVRHTRPKYEQLNRGLELERWKTRFEDESRKDHNGSQSQWGL